MFMFQDSSCRQLTQVIFNTYENRQVTPGTPEPEKEPLDSYEINWGDAWAIRDGLGLSSGLSPYED